MPVLVSYGRAEEWLSPDTEFGDIIKTLGGEVLAEIG